MSKKTGFFITLEGVECSGKSSIMHPIQLALQERQRSVVLTKEPGSTILGKTIRDILLHRTFELDSRAEFLLYAADRAQHRAHVILPALHEGNIVISDRCADSAVAYQGYGRGLDSDIIKQVNAFALNGLTPDLTLYLRIDYHTLQTRLAARATGADVIESEKQAFFERVIEGYDAILKNQSHVVVIDATQPLHVVIEQSIAAIMERLS